MTEADRVLVDTNVILDVVEDDPHWADWSQEQMSRLVGRITVNPLIYTELCYTAPTMENVEHMLSSLGLDFAEMPREALYLAAQAFKAYRQRGGTKTAPLADFFIGAHATAMGIPILTRDPTRYRSYFPDVELITP